MDIALSSNGLETYESTGTTQGIFGNGCLTTLKESTGNTSYVVRKVPYRVYASGEKEKDSQRYIDLRLFPSEFETEPLLRLRKKILSSLWLGLGSRRSVGDGSLACGEHAQE